MDASSMVAPSAVHMPLRQASRRSSLTSSSSANSRLCSCVVKEIIATERQYVCDLRDLVEGYLTCCRSGDFLTMTEIHDIFGNIDAIYRLNSSFLADIENCSEDPIKMANCFYKRCAEFDVYATYCTNYPRSQTTLAYALARPAAQEAFRQQQDSLGHSLPASSYLHKPVQRVLKYPLLLQNLQKYYDGQSDSKRCIEAALRAIRDMANRINEAKRASEHAAQAQQLLGSSSNECDVGNYGDLLMKGIFKLQGAKTCRHVFLFDNAVILAKKREADGEIHYRKAIIKGSDLMLIESVPKEPLCFHLIHYSTPRKLYALQAKSLDEKRAWCIGIKQLIISSLPCTIPDRSKRLLLSTGLDSSTDRTVSGEAKDLLSPLADGAEPMTSLAAVAAAASAAAAPSSKQTWLKSPNLLLRSNARQVPDYLERRRRKGAQFRSYIDLSHFVRKHLARRSDSALSHSAYLNSPEKQSVGYDAAIADVASGENQNPKAILSPSERSLGNSLCHWDSCSGLIRSRSLGSLDLESFRPAANMSDLQCTEVSYDDCCSRAIRLAREFAEKGPGELASIPWISHVYQNKKRSLNDVTRKAKHRAAFRNRPSSELLSPEEEPLREVPPSAFPMSAVAEACCSSTVVDQEACDWRELRRDVTLSSDEGYERGAESDFHEMIPLGSVSNRSSGADFSSPSRCSVVSSETGSSSNEPAAENNDDADEEGDGKRVLLLPDGGASSALTVLHPQAEASETKTTASSVDEPLSANAALPCLDFDSSALSAAHDPENGDLVRATPAATEQRSDDCAVRSAAFDITGYVGGVSLHDGEFLHNFSRGTDFSETLRSRDAVAAKSSQPDRFAEVQAFESSHSHRLQALGCRDTAVSVGTPSSCSTVDGNLAVRLSLPSSRCSQALGGCTEGQPHQPNELDDSTAKPPLPARPSVIRLARQYSTKIKERPARRGAASQLRLRQGSREGQQCKEDHAKQLIASKQVMTSLPEHVGVSHDDFHDKQNHAGPPESNGKAVSESTSYPCQEEETTSGQIVENRQLDLSSACNESRPDEAVPPLADRTAEGDGRKDAADSRRPRSSRHVVSAALRERMRSLERPPVVSRVFTYADVDCQQVDSLRDRIRMLQTSSGAGASTTVADVDEGHRFRELTPPCANTARISCAATAMAAYTRCQSLPSDVVEERTSGSHKHIAVAQLSSCGVAAGRTGRKVSRVEDTAIASGHVRNIVQKFQVH